MSDFTFEAYDPKNCKFERWVDRLEATFESNGIKEAKEKRANIVSCMGNATYNILCDKMAPVKPTTKSYDEIVASLKEHFQPEPLEVVENFLFQSCKRSPNQSVNDYMVELRRKAEKCNFDNHLDKALRNQLVFGIENEQIQRRLLEEKTLTLKKALELALAIEASNQGGALITKGNEVNVVYNHQKKYKKIKKKGAKSGKKQVCFRCGSDSHLANNCNVVSQNTKCSFCKKLGHLAKMCFAAKKSGPKNNNNTNYSNQNDTNLIEEFSGSIDYEEICVIQENKNKCSRYFLEVEVSLKGCKRIVNFEVDSGSPVSLISLDYKNKYFNQFPLLDNDRNLMSFGNPILVHGRLMVQAGGCDGKIELPLYVVDKLSFPLLGRQWINELKIDLNALIYSEVSTVENSDNCAQLKGLLDKYAVVFDQQMGKLKGIQARIHLKSGTVPVSFKPRTVPFALRPLVENQIKRLVDEGIWKKVDYSEWATPLVVVPKANNKVRLCGDYKVTVNPNVFIDEHPLPTRDELSEGLAGGEQFTKIDLTDAYLQMEVHEEDRHILTLSTHIGNFEPSRLMYGFASAAAIWQRKMEMIFGGIDGVVVFLDDIRITGSNLKIHLERLEEVLKRLQNYNLKVNANKCFFLADSIEFCGVGVNRHGIYKLPAKVEAIKNMPAPTNKDEVRALLGFINYYGNFIKNSSIILSPIIHLLRSNVDFVWSEECKNAFEKVKLEFQSNTILVHYDPKLPLILATDASPVGVGAVLSHKYPDGSERPIQFASQTLNPTQSKYTQVCKEAYAIIFGIKKFYQYLFGRKFTLITDNQPICQIFSPNKSLPALTALRMQHYAIFLTAFDYEIKYRNTKLHGNADGLSRLPCNDLNPFKYDEVDIVEQQAIENLPLTSEELAKLTVVDANVKTLIQGLKNGRTVNAKDRFNIDQSEFSLQNNCLLRGIRVYIPQSAREKVLKEVHGAHFGITRMKSLARGYCWWESMDRDIEHLVQNCTECQLSRPDPPSVPKHCWEPATEPFQRIHVDFAGPFLNHNFLVIVDAYSKWLTVKIVSNITTNITIKILDEFFSDFGYPSVLVSDNGVQFTSEQFQTFLKRKGIVHRTSAPYHPATNGQAERYVQTFKSHLKSLCSTSSTLHSDLCDFLVQYRKTVHPATKNTPSMLVFNRQIKSRLDLMLPKHEIEMKSDSNPVRQFDIDDRVRSRDYSSKSGKRQFGKVKEKLGKLHYLIQLDDGRVWKRHIDQVAKVGSEAGTTPVEADTAQVNTPTQNVQKVKFKSRKSRNSLPGTSTDPPNRILSDTIISISSPSSESDTIDTPDRQRSFLTVRRSERTTRRPARFNF